MSEEYISIVIVITVFVIFFALVLESEKMMSNMVYVRSSVNGTNYQVRDLPDKQKAADLIGYTHETLKKICRMLHESYPNDIRVKRLLNRFPNTIFRESHENNQSTSYSINKGEKIVLCLRSKDKYSRLYNNTVENKNLVLFVALHELCHIMTVETGHPKAFWNNFAFLLRECQDKNLYQCIDFSKNPKKYCGIKVTSSPYPCSA